MKPTASLLTAVLAWASPPSNANASAIIISADSRRGPGAATRKSKIGILSFPLLSHRQVVERHRRELQAAAAAEEKEEGGHDGDDDAVDPSSHHRRRRHLSDYDRIPILQHPRRTHGYNETDGRRRSSLASSSSPKHQVGALYQGYGTHYMDLWVGFPAQRQTVVVDTGSSVSAFPCSACVDCGAHADHPFDERASESFVAKTCSVEGADDGCIFGTCMDDGSCLVSRSVDSTSGWTAYEAEDIVYAAGLHDRAIDSPAVDLHPDDPADAIQFSFPLSFGCQMTVTGYFEKQLASGVVGLDKRGQSFWGQMRASQLISRSHFSLCFGKQTPFGSTSGVVTLGGVDKRLHKTPMVFAKSAGDGFTSNYKVQVRKMYLREGNDVSVMNDVKKKYHMLDASQEWLNGDQMYNLESATTDTYFILSLSAAFRSLWKELTGMDYTNEPMPLGNDSGLLKLPTVVLQMIPHDGGIGDEVQTGDPREINGLAGIVDMGTPNDVMLAIPPQHYMQNNMDGTYTPSIYLDRDNALGNVLGANAMMGHDIMFDLEEGRIGFSESDCDYAGLIAGSNGEEVSKADGKADGLLAAQTTTKGKDSSILCTSSRCFGLFAFTLILFLLLCFLFARRYVNRQENVTASDSLRDIECLSEFEMKLKSSQKVPTRDEMPYSDSRYRDTPSSKSSSNGHNGPNRQSDLTSSSRKDQLINLDGDRGSHYPDDRRRERYRDRRRSSRESDDGDFRSSAQSVHTHSSGASGSSEGSRETRQSSRTHHSSRSLGTHHSVRSSGSRQSTRSSGTRESHRTSGSSRSRRDQNDDGRSRYSERGFGSERSTSRRYGDGYRDDDSPRPPPIS